MESNFILAFNKLEFEGQYPRFFETPRLFIPWDIFKVIIGNSATVVYLVLGFPPIYALTFLFYNILLNDLNFVEGQIYIWALLWKNICYTNRYFAAHWLVSAMHFFMFPYTLYDWINYPENYDLSFLGSIEGFEQYDYPIRFDQGTAYHYFKYSENDSFVIKLFDMFYQSFLDLCLVIFGLFTGMFLNTVIVTYAANVLSESLSAFGSFLKLTAQQLDEENMQDEIIG